MGELLNHEDNEPAPLPAVSRLEHLAEGVKPIMACLASPEDFDNKKALMEVFGDDINPKPNKHNVNFYESPERLKSSGMITGEKETYVISPIDGRDKFSYGYADCTGTVMVGLDKETGDNISFMSHQNLSSHTTTPEMTKEFKDELEKKMIELVKRCKDGTIDSVIFGGFSDTGKNDSAADNKQEKKYVDAIKLLGEEVHNIFGFEPLVMTGPKTVDQFMGGNRDFVSFNNKERQLQILRLKSKDKSLHSFLPRQIDDYIKDFRKPQ